MYGLTVPVPRQRVILPRDVSNVPLAHVRTIVLLPAHAVSIQSLIRQTLSHPQETHSLSCTLSMHAVR